MYRTLFITQRMEGCKDTAGSVCIGGTELPNVSRRSRSLLEPMPVPDCAFTRVGGHFEILRELQTIGRASVLTKSAKHAARGVVCECRQDLTSRGVVALPANDDQIFRAGQRTKIASNAQRLAGFWIDIEAGRAAIALRNHRPFQGILLSIDVLWVLRAKGEQQALPEVHHKHPAKYLYHSHLVCGPCVGLSRRSGRLR